VGTETVIRIVGDVFRLEDITNTDIDALVEELESDATFFTDREIETAKRELAEYKKEIGNAK